MAPPSPPSATDPADAKSRTADADGPSHPSEGSSAQAWRQVAVQLAQIRAFAAHYLQARIDAVRLSIRRLVIFSALALVGLVALSAVAVMMVVFLFLGIAGGFGELFHGRLWLGDLVTMGIFVLVLIAGGSWTLGAIGRANRRRTVQKYETRQSQQRVSFGTDVHRRAAAPDTALTEAEFLQQQAANAKAAVGRALGDLKSQLAAGIDPRGWVQDHPWLTLAGVAGAAFVATTATVPSKEEQALKKLAAIEAAIHRDSSATSSKSNGHAADKESRSLLAMMLWELVGVVKPILSSLFTEMIHPTQTGQAAPAAPSDGGGKT